MNHRKKILNILREESSIENQLLSMVKDIGVKKTAKAVGGYKNLIKIMGKSKIIDLLLSNFEDLYVEKRGSHPLLMDGGIILMENLQSFWGLGLSVFDSAFRYRIDEEMIDFYLDNRRTLVKELVNRFPELYSEDVTVFKDNSKYLIFDKFKFDDLDQPKERLTESNDLQKNLLGLMKTYGVVAASKAVGGIQRLSKILDINLEDRNEQKILVKNFIYFHDVEDVKIDYLEIKTSSSGGHIIKVHGTTTDTASNMDSWYINHICDAINKFFPFNAAPSYHPVFASAGIKIFIDSELKYIGD